jgi:hypothetical protein
MVELLTKQHIAFLGNEVGYYDHRYPSVNVIDAQKMTVTTVKLRERRMTKIADRISPLTWSMKEVLKDFCDRALDLCVCSLACGTVQHPSNHGREDSGRIHFEGRRGVGDQSDFLGEMPHSASSRAPEPGTWFFITSINSPSVT